MSKKVEIPRVVFNQLEKIRMSGATNMIDRKAVQYWCSQQCFYEAVVWLEENYKEYANGVFNGFEPKDES